MAGALVVGQFDDEGKDLFGVGRYGGTDFEVMGNLPVGDPAILVRLLRCMKCILIIGN